MRWWLLVAVVKSQTTRELASMPCPNLCSRNGWCDGHDRRCACYDGYSGSDCSLRLCPMGTAWADEPDDIVASDVAHTLAECSRRGLCDRVTGECVCGEGYEGSACERKSCGNDCSGNGKCVSMQHYAKAFSSFTYENVWDARKIYGCVCDPGFGGYDCSLRLCPTGDDPGTSGESEIQSFVCKADGGSLVLGFDGEWTSRISHAADESVVKAALEELTTVTTPNGIKVTFSSPATTMCDKDGETTTYVEFLQNFGDLSLLVADEETTTLALSDGNEASVEISRFRKGTKENVDCSNRGICDTTTGTCECSVTSACLEDCFTTSDGYGGEGTRGDCGAAVVTVDTCPGEVECNSHGVCDETTLSCTCQEGYSGADCSLMTCPYGRSWFSQPTDNDVAHRDLAECSNGGICNRISGECECDATYEGAACEYMVCPGDETECSGHGECLSMALLAGAATVNGVLSSLTYGAMPNDAETWDWDVVRGCKCDPGYTNFDCSGHVCPFGDDPLSVNQFNEVQLLNCDLDASSATGSTAITFTFREQTAALTAETATIADLESILESMESIEDVMVYSDIGVSGASDRSRKICSNAGTDTYVEFLRPTGDVPLITTNRGTITSFGEFTKGTKEWEECSGRGLCNREDGTCTCNVGYGSSDGQGSPGPYADCGSQLPVVLEDS